MKIVLHWRGIDFSLYFKRKYKHERVARHWSGVFTGWRIKCMLFYSVEVIPVNHLCQCFWKDLIWICVLYLTSGLCIVCWVLLECGHSSVDHYINFVHQTDPQIHTQNIEIFESCKTKICVVVWCFGIVSWIPFFIFQKKRII